MFNTYIFMDMDNEEVYTMNELAGLIKKDKHSVVRIMTFANVEPDGVKRKKPAYFMSTFKNAEQKYKLEKQDGRSMSSPYNRRASMDDGANTPNGEVYAELRLRKLHAEIDSLERDNIKKDLQIEQLKSRLIDKEEVFKYLVTRKAVELAVLRRILFTNLPIDIPGLTMAKAREKAESYYNEIIKDLKTTCDVWQHEYNISDDEEERVNRNLVRIFLGAYAIQPTSGNTTTGSNQTNGLESSGSLGQEPTGSMGGEVCSPTGSVCDTGSV